MITYRPSIIYSIRPQTKMLWYFAIKKDANFLRKIDNEKFDEKMYIEILGQLPRKIIYDRIPDKFKTNEFHLKLIDKNPNCIEFIEQTEELCILAIKNNLESLCLIKNITENIFSIVISKIKCDTIPFNSKIWPHTLNMMKYQPEELCYVLIRKDSSLIRNIKNPTKEMRELAFELDKSNIIYVENPTTKMLMEAFKHKKSNIDRL